MNVCEGVNAFHECFILGSCAVTG
jgi:predicted DNA binding CopG/RHH family protein